METTKDFVLKRIISTTRSLKLSYNFDSIFFMLQIYFISVSTTSFSYL